MAIALRVYEMREGSPIINENLQISHLVHFDCILQQVSLPIIVYLVNLNQCQNMSV